MERWAGRVALVTGASGGIGGQVAKELVRYGMRVVACDRNIETLERMKVRVQGLPGEFLPVRCDLRNEADIDAMFREIKEKHGGADVLVNSAGLGHFQATLLHGTNEQFREMFEVNLLALTICSREAVNSMLERGVDDGHVFNLCSMSGHRLVDKSENFYGCTKYGVNAHTEGLRRELRELRTHIRVTQISPGNVDTGFVNHAIGDDEVARRHWEEEGPGMKEMEPNDICDALIYALAAPPHVQVHDIQIRPTEQID